MTAAFKDRIEAHCGKVAQYLPLGKVRNLSLLGILGHLRQLDGERLFIAIEHNDSKPLIGPLRLVALASKSLSHLCRDARLHSRTNAARTADPDNLGSVKAQFTSRIRLRAALSRAKDLRSSKSSQSLKASATRQIAFLDANLSFGVSAGGSLGHIKGVIDSLDEHGFSVRYISTKPTPTDRRGVGYVHVPPPSMLAFPAELNYYLHHYDFDRVASGSIAQQAVDFIYQRMSLHNFSGVAIARTFGVPVVVEYNGSEAWTAENLGT